MVAKKMNRHLYISLFASTLLTASVVCASEVDKNTAKMQAMDKITGRVSEINVPVNGEIKFGSLSIVIRSCKTRPAEETPDNFAFVDIADTTLQGEEFNVFKGWMISSSPATSALEHPIYDVWLLKCIDSEISPDSLLSAEKLAARDNLPRIADSASHTIKTDDVTLLQSSEPLQEMTEENKGTLHLEPSEEFFYDEEDVESEETAETAETEFSEDL